MTEHKKRRDKVAALERELAEVLIRGKYHVLNKVSSRHEVDAELWASVRKAFADHFPELN